MIIISFNIGFKFFLFIYSMFRLFNNVILISYLDLE